MNVKRLFYGLFLISKHISDTLGIEKRHLLFLQEKSGMVLSTTNVYHRYTTHHDDRSKRVSMIIFYSENWKLFGNNLENHVSLPRCPPSSRISPITNKANAYERDLFIY